jgi:hypothetical protein
VRVAAGEEFYLDAIDVVGPGDATLAAETTAGTI